MRKPAVLAASMVCAALVLVWWSGRDGSLPGHDAALNLDSIAVFEGPDMKVMVEAGARVFEASCAACHGQAAAGGTGLGPPLVHHVYRPAHHADGAFFLAVKNGVRAHHWSYGNMAPVPGLSDVEIAQVTAYVRARQRASGIE